MIIMFTMAGASSRFVDAGYLPKYMLELRPGLTMFEASLRSFWDFFLPEHLFVFVTRGAEMSAFVRSKLEKIKNELDVENSIYRGLSPFRKREINYKICMLSDMTRGQAETAYVALKFLWKDLDEYMSSKVRPSISIFDMPGSMPASNLCIFNIDTIRKHFLGDYKGMMHRINSTVGTDGANTPSQPGFVRASGVFDAFFDSRADEKKWSFCAVTYPIVDGKVTKHPLEITKTAEKKKISNWCSTGLYMFGAPEIYRTAYERACREPDYNYYIAPLYNYLKGKVYLLECPRDHVEFAGVPDDYEKLKIKYTEEYTEDHD